MNLEPETSEASADAPEETSPNLTIWGSPGTTFPSQFGMVTYREWCEKESARMNALGAATRVEERGGLICITK